MSGGAEERQRLDVWLWRARFFKTRAAAAAAIAAGGVRITRQGASRIAAKPAERLQLGDGLALFQGGRLQALEVLGFPQRRGPAPEARSHYRLNGATEDPDALDAGPGGGHVPPAADP